MEVPDPPVEQAKEQENMTTDKENAMLPPAAAVIPRRGSMPSREQSPKGKGGGKMNMNVCVKKAVVA